MAKQKTALVPRGMTRTAGYYNGENRPIQLVLSKLNVTLYLKPGEFILGRDKRKINDPLFEMFTGDGLSRELSDVLLPINSGPPEVSECQEKTHALTDTLCTRCGLCCDGSLFADVELASGDEASALEVMGLEIEDDDDGGGGLLLQPCGALQGKRCSIYPHRPDCCRMFACRLLQEVERGMVGVGRAKEKIAEAWKRIEGVKELVVQLGTGDERLPLKEHCAEALALSEAAAAGPAVARKRAELEAAMISVERLVWATFLGG